MRKGRNHTAFRCNVTLMLVLIACITSHVSYSQKITNVDFEVIGNTVKIEYDINGCSDDKNYDIQLLLGSEGELTEISRGLSGDIKDVPCGSSKVILWDVLSDRNELKGRIYFAVEIQRIHPLIQPMHEEIQETKSINESKEWRRRSWKADKGYVGGSIGIFAPNTSYSSVPYNPTQNGFYLNTTVGYLPSLLLGVSTTVYFYGAPKLENLRITTWKTCGVMIGPLISLPLGNRIKWEMRPQIGYSMIYPNPTSSYVDSLSSTSRSGVSYAFGTGLRLNFGKRTCYMLNVEYLSAARKVEGYKVEPDLRLLGASFGIAFRFY